LLDEGDLSATHIVHMKFSAEGEYLAFHIIAIPTGFVLDGELVAPGEHFLLYVQFHYDPPIIIQAVIPSAFE
jgi:hypothetical protein